MSFGFLVPIALFAMIFWIVKTMSDNKVRKQAIQNGNLDESLKHLWQRSYQSKPLQNLKLAMICSGVGIAFILGYAIVLAETLVFGLACLFVGAAYGIYYYLDKKEG